MLQRCVAAGRAALSARHGAGLSTPRADSASLRHASGLPRCQHHPRTSTSRLPYIPGQTGAKALQLGLCTKAGNPEEDEYPPLPAYTPDPGPEKREVYIVQAEGLPWSCTADDVLCFFSDCRIRDGVNGIHLTLNSQGSPSGQAFIELEHEEDVRKALEKHRQYLGPRYVEVREVTNSAAESILKTPYGAAALDGVVRLRGLPYSSTEADIHSFFSGLDIVETGVTIVKDFRGRNSGEAYVQFSSQEAADEALQRDRELIGNRYIEVFSSRSSEIRSSWRKNDAGPVPSTKSRRGREEAPAPPQNHRSASVFSSAVPLHYVHMRGLPFQVNARDIVQFFSPLPLSRILLEFGPDGRPSGEADVFFRSHQDAVLAMSRDKLHIGQRYVELFLNSIPTNADQG